ncbi:hypothetical protein Bca52824_095049 [Brassica carinata]|uniref:CREG-like beta-barrel domain-containing protein n=1 Tax=Brassica carinata TaxID=52824 RepID=A0A8X7P132_BRACI|nr:hypothetical protein Bca52824_095049 [Brassica carinata]
MTMDALSTSSSYISNLPQINPIFKYSLPSSHSSCRLCNPRRIPNLRISDGSSHGGIRIQALSHNDDTPSEGDAESSGLGLFPEDIFSLSQTSLALPQGAGNSGGNRAGLFRTPISGGVQNATSAHALPPPALAVRNLLEQEGYPFGSLVDFAPDRMGHPLFLFSPLAIHTRNLLAEPRCSLVVQVTSAIVFKLQKQRFSFCFLTGFGWQMPGWSGLSNARVTLFGDVYPLSQDEQEWAQKQYSAKHHHGPSSSFGTVAWVDVKEYEALQRIRLLLMELNAIFSKPLRELLSTESEVDDAALISIDSRGIDVRVRQGAQFNIQRLAFEEGHGVETLEEAKAALWKVMEKVKLLFAEMTKILEFAEMTNPLF